MADKVSEVTDSTAWYAHMDKAWSFAEPVCCAGVASQQINSSRPLQDTSSTQASPL